MDPVNNEQWVMLSFKEKAIESSNPPNWTTPHCLKSATYNRSLLLFVEPLQWYHNQSLLWMSLMHNIVHANNSTHHCYWYQEAINNLLGVFDNSHLPSRSLVDYYLIDDRYDQPYIAQNAVGWHQNKSSIILNLPPLIYSSKRRHMIDVASKDEMARQSIVLIISEVVAP